MIALREFCESLEWISEPKGVCGDPHIGSQLVWIEGGPGDPQYYGWCLKLEQLCGDDAVQCA